MLKLSFSTNAFVRFSVCEAVAGIAAAGFEGVEILADVPHLFAPRVLDSELEQIKRVLSRSGLRVANVNANTAVGYYGGRFWEPLFEPSLANPEPDARKWRIEYSKKCIEIAHELECPNVSVTSGRMVPGTLPSESLELLSDSMETLLRHGEAHGVRIGMEYEPGLLVERCEELASLLDALNSPWFGANLDLGHSHVLGEDPELVIGTLGSRVFHVHVEDIAGRKHFHLVPGLGEVDFRLLFRLLAENHYDGFITVELYTYPHQPDVAAAQSLAHLQRFIHREPQVEP